MLILGNLGKVKCTEVDMKIYNLYLFSTFFQRHSIVVHKSYIAGHADSSFPVHILYIELGEQVTFENEALRKTHVNLPGIKNTGIVINDTL